MAFRIHHELATLNGFCLTAVRLLALARLGTAQRVRLEDEIVARGGAVVRPLPVAAFVVRLNPEAMLLAEIGDFTRFRNGKQLARYCGLAPVNCSSGERQRQSGIGKACNGDLRRVLIEASHRLSRYTPRWCQMKRHLIGEGKKQSVATVAVANRWIRRLHYEMTHPVAATQEDPAT